MAILTHDEIIRRVRAGEIGIDPFDETLVGPASVDLHLATQFRVFKRVRDIFHVTEEAAYELGATDGSPARYRSRSRSRSIRDHG